MDRAELARRLGTTLARAATGVSGGVEPRVLAVPEGPAWERAFAEAVAAGGPVFLADPAWGAAERAALEEARQREPAEVAGDGGWLAVPSGGTSGRLKFARHDAATLAAAVQGYATHFGLARVNSLGLLPRHHVSGLMAWLRCVLTGGSYVAADWKAVEAGVWPAWPAEADAAEGAVVSLVSTQLARLLERGETAAAWLRRFRVVHLGGGPAWPELLERAAAARVPLALGYGMTETAAMVASQRPEEFLAGDRSAGTALPHARVTVSAAHAGPDEDTLVIAAASLFRGYWPDARAATTATAGWTTEDRGAVDAMGRVTVHGRRDALIVTGGKKVDPAEVEAALRATGWFAEVAVLGVPDAEWGERVVACVSRPTSRERGAEGRTSAAVLDLTAVTAALAGQLSAHKIPKRLVAVEPWPQNAQGKVNRAALRAAALDAARLLKVDG